MQAEALSKIRKLAGEAFHNTVVFLAYAYGSRISGRARPDSDLDMGYYLHPSCGVQSLPIEEEMLLAARLSRRLGVEVDLRSLDTAPLELRGRVLEDGARIYCSDDVARVSLETAVLAQYHDYKPMFEAMHSSRLLSMAGAVNGG